MCSDGGPVRDHCGDLARFLGGNPDFAEVVDQTLATAGEGCDGFLGENLEACEDTAGQAGR